MTHPAGNPSPTVDRRATALLLAGLLLLMGILTVARVRVAVPFHGGDHGFNLYVFARTARGETPFRDTLWPYGALPPYVYAFGFLLLGESIRTALLVHLLLQAAAGVTGFFLYRRLLPDWAAFAAALGLFAFSGQVHAFNHVVMLPLLPLALGCFWHYLEDPDRGHRWLAGCLALQVLQGLVLYSLAAASSFALCWGLLIAGVTRHPRAERSGRALASALVPPVAFGLAWLLLTLLAYLPWVAGMPRAHLWTCFGSLLSSLAPLAPPSYWVLEYLALWRDWAAGRTDLGLLEVVFHWRALPLVWALTALASLRHLFAPLLRREPASPTALLLATLSLVNCLTGFYFLSVGAWYSLRSAALVTTLALLGWELRAGAAWLGRRLGGMLRRSAPAAGWGAGAAFVLAAALVAWDARAPLPASAQPLAAARGQVRLCLPGQRETLERVTAFIEAETRPGEEIVVWPYDLVYLFLAGRRSATYYAVADSRIGLTPDREEEMIADLERQRTRCVVLTNTGLVTPEGAEVFGATFCMRLGRYLVEHYELVAQFDSPAGEGAPGPGAAEQVRILWRRGAPR